MDEKRSGGWWARGAYRVIDWAGACGNCQGRGGKMGRVLFVLRVFVKRKSFFRGEGKRQRQGG